MPTPRDVHVDAVLSQVANQYRNRAFLAPDLFPVVPVQKESGIYWKYGKERFEVIDSRRAPKTEARTIEWALDQDTYQTVGYALADWLSDEELANADIGLNLEATSTELVTELLYVAWEKRVAALLIDVSVFAHDTPGDLWDTDAGDPLLDIQNAVDALPFVDPNTIVMGKRTWNAFRRNPKVLAVLSGNERKTVSLATAQDLTSIPNWKIGAAYYATNKRGKTTTLARIWDDDVWIGYIAPNPGPKELSVGYTFRNKAFQTQTEYNRRRHSTWIEVAYSQGEVITCAEAGYIWEAVLS